MFDDALSLHRLGESHRALLADIAALDDLAHDLLADHGAQGLTRLDEVLRLLRGRLTAHMDLEERVVYPAIAADLAIPGAMEWMLEDHREIRRWVDDLGRHRAELDIANAEAVEPVRRALYVIGALVHLHLRKEEATYARLLERRLEPRPA